MSFIQLVRREMHGSLPKLLIMSAIGGVSNASILAAINTGVQDANNGQKPGLWAAALFLLALILFMRSQQYVTITATAEIEAIIHKLRVRIMDMIRRSELLEMERIGRARIVASVTSDTTVLTQASNMLAFTVQGAVLIFFVGIYVAYLSIVAFLLTVVIVVGAGTIFHYRNKRLAAQKMESAAWERRLFDRLTDFLDGFKEVRLNNLRSDDLFNDAMEVSKTAANIKIRTQAETFKMIVTSQISMYILLAAVVFVAPNLSDTLGGSSIAKTTTALLFIVGACFGLVQSIPILLNANVAAERIARLEQSLRATLKFDEPREIVAPKRFERIDMKNIVFRYVDRFSDTAFRIGPINFSMKAGDLVFITGGNGSGKSTFLRVLSGLYPPDSGDFTLDGRPVDNASRDEYRGLMSAIFFDYHLFQKLYGVSDADPAEISRLLAKFRLTDKTGLVNGEFRTLDLSGGQRRRLALIVSMLEKRPIMILDEWTAEQDPEFRRKFYDELLPEMMAAGATIVVITHDDRYLDELNLPARRIRMEEGRIVEEHTMGGR
ncbi:MAG TPA: cyclic peptide export ABC transporter [Xanthobacteraceae bacterium]|jgi:putative ATP-binding cassette transporter|nr:cyclic peptide export ABC transporter [Xanthobacteraceae bacterium]